MPFGLKNAPSEFQRIMNDIFNLFSKSIHVYIDDVLIFSTSIDKHFKHLKVFFNVVKENGLVLSKTKYSLFEINILFLGHNEKLLCLFNVQSSLLINSQIIFLTKPNFKDFYVLSTMFLISSQISTIFLNHSMTG
jgi:hypothetical protein